MDLNAQIYDHDASPLNDGENDAPMGVCGMLAAIWLWLGMLSRCLLGRGVIHGDTPETPFVSPDINRAQRRLHNHHPNTPLPPARNLSPFYHFGPRVSATQFLERLCRISGKGRIRVYRLRFRLSRAAREAVLAIFSRGDFRMADGVCAVRLGPD